MDCSICILAVCWRFQMAFLVDKVSRLQAAGNRQALLLLVLFLDLGLLLFLDFLNIKLLLDLQPSCPFDAQVLLGVPVVAQTPHASVLSKYIPGSGCSSRSWSFSASRAGISSTFALHQLPWATPATLAQSPKMSTNSPT